MTGITASSAPVAIEKTGTNALTVSMNAIQTREPVPVRVLEGTLNIVPGTDPGLEQPACLRLDFAGTNRIDRLRLNGKSVAGYIDASHPSGLVSGIGCLEVRPKGTVIMFK